MSRLILKGFVWAAFVAAPPAALAQDDFGRELRGTLDEDGRARPPVDDLAIDLSSDEGPLIAVFVDGATIYDQATLAAIYAHRLGRPADQQALVELAEDITSRYRADGYFLSRAAIAPQPVARAGLAQLVVYEGYIAEIRFVGEAPERARQLMEGLSQERPIRLASLDRRLALLRDTPGLRVRSAELEPMADDPAAHVLVLTLEQARAGGEIRLDNRGSDDEADWRLTLSSKAYGWFVPGDETELRVLTAPSDPDQLAALELNYRRPLGEEGASLRLEAGAGESIDVSGDDRELAYAAARYAHPLAAGRAAESSIFFELAGFDARERRAGAVIMDETLVSAALGIYGRWRNGLGSTSYFSQVLLGRAASPRDDLRSRFDADDDYARLNLALRHRARLEPDLALTLRAAAQIADGPLPRPEEMALGGRLFGRGYRPGALRGDSALALSLEAAYLGAPDALFYKQLQPYFFVDGAMSFNGPFNHWSRDELASAGLGLRLYALDHLNLEWEAAKPVINLGQDQSWRHNLNVRVGF